MCIRDRVINYDYDANGNVISATVVVETSEGEEERKTTYVYDSMNRVIETIEMCIRDSIQANGKYAKTGCSCTCIKTF